MKNARVAMYSVLPFHNIDIRELVDEHEYTREDSLSDSIALGFSKSTI